MLRSAKTTQPTQIPQTPEALDLAPQFLEVVACPSCHSTFALDYDVVNWSAPHRPADWPSRCMTESRICVSTLLVVRRPGRTTRPPASVRFVLSEGGGEGNLRRLATRVT